MLNNVHASLATNLSKSPFQAIQEVVSIMVVKENILAVYSPDNDMMACTWHIDTFVSRHDRMLQIQQVDVN